MPGIIVTNSKALSWNIKNVKHNDKLSFEECWSAQGLNYMNTRISTKMYVECIESVLIQNIHRKIFSFDDYFRE